MERRRSDQQIRCLLVMQCHMYLRILHTMARYLAQQGGDGTALMIASHVASEPKGDLWCWAFLFSFFFFVSFSFFQQRSSNGCVPWLLQRACGSLIFEISHLFTFLASSLEAPPTSLFHHHHHQHRHHLILNKLLSPFLLGFGRNDSFCFQRYSRNAPGD